MANRSAKERDLKLGQDLCQDIHRILAPHQETAIYWIRLQESLLKRSPPTYASLTLIDDDAC